MKLNDWTNDIHQGDAAETLSELPDSSVHMAMTSPPYFGLRDYGVDGQIGLEESLEEYIASIVEVAEELHRVLRSDGSWWLNLGDSYACKPRGNKKPVEATGLNNNAESFDAQDSGVDTTQVMGRKQKMLIPHRVAIALQDAGWVVRSDAVWAKQNPMPDPTKDRLREDKEFLFHLTPQPDYWFDLDSIREPHKEASISRRERDDSRRGGQDTYGQTEHTGFEDYDLHPSGKNPGDLLEVSVKPFPDAHFAVYPPELCKKPIKATAPPKVCEGCGTPYERDVERTMPPEPDHRESENRLNEGESGNVDGSGLGPRYSKLSGQEYVQWKEENPDQFNGWAKQCNCPTSSTRPGIVLDPFSGAGTTCLVAKNLGRRFIGIDLNPDYVAMAQSRVGVTVDEPNRLLDDESQTGLEAYTDGGS